jgi:hypothetical protein
MPAHRHAPSAAIITFIVRAGSDSWRNICCAFWGCLHIAARPVTSAFSGGVERREQASPRPPPHLTGSKYPASSKPASSRKARGRGCTMKPSAGTAAEPFKCCESTASTVPASQCAVGNGCRTSDRPTHRVIRDRRIPHSREWESGIYREPRQPLPGLTAGPR